jgi:hypothetical protein
VLSSSVDEKINSAVAEANKSSKSEYDKLKGEFDSLQNSYTDIEKRNTDLSERNKSLSLENVMTRQGFKEEDFKDITAMRYSMYADEKDDVKAIESIKEKYKNTYFPTQVVEPPKQKDDKPINNGSAKPDEIKVNRFTKIKDLMK